MKNWMRALAEHYETTRSQYPEDKLIILFDIDGTILDIRYTILKILKSYDQAFGTSYFKNTSIIDIQFNEDDIEDYLANLNIDDERASHIHAWYQKNRWTKWATFEANKPFPGVLEVIRWFQLQPNTFVGLNSNRDETLREETLLTLNKLAEEFRVSFDNELLLMKPGGMEDNSGQVKCDGIQRIRDAGYRVFAVVDNEPENLERIESINEGGEILLLHASGFYQYRNHNLPETAIDGKVYDITQLVPGRSIPSHIQFVWQGINNMASLNKFLNSNVSWADVTDLTYPLIHQRRNAFNGTNWGDGNDRMFKMFDEFIEQLNEADRGIRISIENDFAEMEFIFDKLQEHNIDSRRLWFSAQIDVLNQGGFRFLSESFPDAVIEAPVDFLSQIVTTTPKKAEQLLDMYSSWGINRFALSWKTSHMKRQAEFLERSGFQTTIYDIRNLESFLKSALLLPSAIVSNFNFPDWKNLQEFDELNEA